MTRSNFPVKRDNIAKFADKCMKVAHAHGYVKEENSFLHAMKSLASEKVTVLVIGEVKRGKSTVVSALVEDDGLFPIDQDVTTCIVTTAVYGERERVKVLFQDGTSKEINRDEITLYANEANNRKNAKAVKRIELEIPNPNLKDGVMYVDTPGIGSLNPLHTAATLDYLPAADVVLFISDAQAPLTDSELTFLKGVKKYCENFIFVLTKTDLNAGYESIINSNKDKISEYAGMDREKIVYVPVTAASKLLGIRENDKDLIESSNCAELEAELWDAVERNRAEVILSPSLNTIAGGLAVIKSDIELRETAQSGDSEKQNGLRDKLQAEINQINTLEANKAQWMSKITDVSSETQNTVARIIADYRNNTSALFVEAQSKVKAPHPNDIMNQLLFLTDDAKEKILTAMAEDLYDAKAEFEKDTGMSLPDTAELTLTAHEFPELKLKKKGFVGRLATIGPRSLISATGVSIGFGAIGGLIGGIVGMIGGPIGAVAGSEIGAGIGAWAGATHGALSGMDALKTEELQQLIPAWTNFVNTNANNWTADARNIPSAFKQLGKDIAESLSGRKRQLTANAEQLKQSMSHNEAELKKAAVKLNAVKGDFVKLYSEFGGLLK